MHFLILLCGTRQMVKTIASVVTLNVLIVLSLFLSVFPIDFPDTKSCIWYPQLSRFVRVAYRFTHVFSLCILWRIQRPKLLQWNQHWNRATILDSGIRHSHLAERIPCLSFSRDFSLRVRLLCNGVVLCWIDRDAIAGCCRRFSFTLFKISTAPPHFCYCENFIFHKVSFWINRSKALLSCCENNDKENLRKNIKYLFYFLEIFSVREDCIRWGFLGGDHELFSESP